MSTNFSPAGDSPADLTGLAAWMKFHPLTAFFGMAYGFAWLLWVPLLTLSKNGLGWLPIHAPALPLVILGGFGPAAAAIIMTAVLGGQGAVRRLLRRCIQWRVGVQWYVLAIFLTPVAFLFTSVLLGAIPLSTVIQNWPLVLTVYPLVLIPQVLIGGGLGEEPGWRGFALPEMQSRFGPLPASVILGTLHAGWHIPLFFVPELSQAHFNFLVYWLAALFITVLQTWAYNNTGGSLLIAMLLHEAQDTTSVLSLRIAPQFLERTPEYAIVFGVAAIAALLLTRGRLSYERAQNPPVPKTSAAEAS